MPETAVADTGPLLHLAQIRQEGQLTVFVRVSISRQVQEDLARRVVFDQIAVVLRERLVVESATSPEMDAQMHQIPTVKHGCHCLPPVAALPLTPQ